jgi:hypothetical protein
VRERRGGHHPAAAGAQLWLQQPGEQVGRQVVDLERALVAVDGQLAPGERGAGVVDQDVDARQPGQLRGEPADVVQPGEVDGVRPGAVELGGDGGGPLRRPPDDHHLRAGPVQPPGGRRTDAVAGPGDDDDRPVRRAQFARSTRTTGISRTVFCW